MKKEITIKNMTLQVADLKRERVVAAKAVTEAYTKKDVALKLVEKVKLEVNDLTDKAKEATRPQP